ncbi:MAG: Phosphoserine phosphatase RsbP [Spirochaetes bacterium ADurb.Bin269]|nr:MAG: Phosphoserine phosphatase RsbP [Spirochaetes bacterium ADurb.Bin269]
MIHHPGFRTAAAAVLAAVLIGAVPGCRFSASGGNSASGGSAARISLKTGWEWTRTPHDDGSWHPVPDSMLSTLDLLPENSSGIFWMRQIFSVPESLAGKRLSAYLGRITMADRVWLNGIYIGGKGSMENDTLSEWNSVRLYSIPGNALGSGQNTLLVQIRGDNEAALVSDPFIGETEDAQRAAFIEDFWNSIINILCAAMMVIVGLYHLMLYVLRRVEKENLTFAVLNLVTALYLSNFFITGIPLLSTLSFLTYQKVVANALPFIIGWLFTLFVRQFLRRKEKLPVRIALIALAAIPIILVMFAPDYGTLRSLRLVTQLFIFPTLAYTMSVTVYSFFKRNREAKTLLWGLSPLLGSVVIDIFLHQVLHLYSLPYITSLGWQMVILSLLFVLAVRFSKARNDVEELNVSLEQKVVERTAELSEANERLKITNDDLEDARKKADRDMKMAAFVQQSFFHRRSPSVDGWDIAFHFKPMSGVSGDLYDFYTEAHELRGIGLFDVSGHGIASGLVTMLGKTIVYREFTHGYAQPLGSVLTAIDRKLIEEKGDVENYLTGMLLRIRDNRVEYVNAAHPDLYYRSGRTGTVRPVRLEGKSVQGRMLGIDGLSDGYTAIGFTMAEEDALLLYTDCLPESRNAAGEEFGVDRITQAFASSGDGFASDKLESLMAEFRNFIGDVPLNDDLTVIVLQRTSRKKEAALDFELPM